MLLALNMRFDEVSDLRVNGGGIMVHAKRPVGAVAPAQNWPRRMACWTGGLGWARCGNVVDARTPTQRSAIRTRGWSKCAGPACSEPMQIASAAFAVVLVGLVRIGVGGSADHVHGQGRTKKPVARPP